MEYVRSSGRMIDGYARGETAKVEITGDAGAVKDIKVEPEELRYIFDAELSIGDRALGNYTPPPNTMLCALATLNALFGANNVDSDVEPMECEPGNIY